MHVKGNANAATAAASSSALSAENAMLKKENAALKAKLAKLEQEKHTAFGAVPNKPTGSRAGPPLPRGTRTTSTASPALTSTG